MFEKFTEGAIKVIMVSQEEARRMGHNFVGTEQLLLGVIGQRHGIGAKALKKLKITLKKTRKEIELYIGRGNGFVASEIPFTPRAKRVLEMAVQEGKDLGQNFVGPEHILLALSAEKDGVALRTLNKLQVDIPRLRNLVLALIEEMQEELLRPLTQAEKFLLEREKKVTGTPTLDEFAENLTKAAVDGALDPVIGRDKEIADVISVLARRNKNNPVLIGEPGVGKTAVAEGLAQLLLTSEAPPFLEGSVILALDIGNVLAGTKYRGEFEDRLKRIVEEVQNDPAIIIVIDEIHTIVGAGAAEGSVDAANILKPALARSKFKCIGATTKEEYTRYIERDAALERRFQPILVEEPTPEVALEIVRGMRVKFEQHHGLVYDREAVVQAVMLSHQYIKDRYLPDKALDVLDEAGARVRLQNRFLPNGLNLLLEELKQTIIEKHEAFADHKLNVVAELYEHEKEIRTYLKGMKKKAIEAKMSGIRAQDVDRVTEEDVAAVVSNWTRIPVTKLTGSESERLLKMEDILHERLIGQEHAVTSVSQAIRRARVGLRDPKRPMASFIFAGPTGVGKTELTKALAEFMFGNEKSMVRLDMSEYMEKHTVSKLIGSPPGYVGYNEGGVLTEGVKSTPYCIVLFDEVEKAHPDVFNLLLQVLDDGRLTDSQGRTIDFTNTLVIMTTNLGSKTIEVESGIKSKSKVSSKPGTKIIENPSLKWEPEPEPMKDTKLFEHITQLVNEQLKNFFKPEFLNRIDEIIVFNHLSRYNIWEICQLLVKQLEDRLAEKDVELVVGLSARAFLADEGYEPIYGARPLRRAIMQYLENVLVDASLKSGMQPHSRITIERKKVEGSMFKYFNELEAKVEADVTPAIHIPLPKEDKSEGTLSERYEKNPLLPDDLKGDDNDPANAPIITEKKSRLQNRDETVQLNDKSIGAKHKLKNMHSSKKKEIDRSAISNTPNRSIKQDSDYEKQNISIKKWNSQLRNFKNKVKNIIKSTFKLLRRRK